MDEFTMQMICNGIVAVVAILILIGFMRYGFGDDLPNEVEEFEERH